MRLMAYAVGFAITYGLLLLLPEKEHGSSFIGQRTLPIYLFHGLVYKTVESFGWIDMVQTIPQTLLFLITIVLLTCVLATKPFAKLLQLLCFEFQ